jgi:hypothetical protein
MHKAKNKFLLLGLFCFVSFFYSYGQTPATDPTWILQDGTHSTTDLSDEFSGSSVNTTKWHVFDCTTDPYCSWGQATGMNPSYTTESGGYLNFKVDGNICPTCNCPQNCTGVNQYNTGGVQSQSTSYSYGYLEMYAQLPGFVDGSGVAHADKFWPAFWTSYDTYDSGTCNNPNSDHCDTYHNEIDMMDQCCNYYSDAKSTGTGVNIWTGGCNGAAYPNGHCTTNVLLPSNWMLYQHTNILCYNNQTSTTNYHKYAVEWNAGKVVFYFDDMSVSELYNSAISMVSMFLVIDLQLSSSVNFYSGFPFSSSANSSMSLDYLRYYKLNLDCSTNTTISNSTDFTNYFNIVTPTSPGPPAVKSNITIGTGSSSISLGSTDTKIFRAVNSITVLGDFTVPSGATLALLPTACN